MQDAAATSVASDDMTHLKLLILLLVLALASLHDLKHRKIPNFLSYSAFLTGILFGAAQDQEWNQSSLIAPLLGAAIGFSMTFPLYLLRTLGAGDVKLISAVGAFIGPEQILGAILLTFVSGGFLAIGIALMNGLLRQTMDNLRLFCLFAITGKTRSINISDLPPTGKLPYAIAIATGTLLQIAISKIEGWPFV